MTDECTWCGESRCDCAAEHEARANTTYEIRIGPRVVERVTGFLHAYAAYARVRTERARRPEWLYVVNVDRYDAPDTTTLDDFEWDRFTW